MLWIAANATSVILFVCTCLHEIVFFNQKQAIEIYLAMKVNFFSDQ
jgi:hypothetical protein